METTTVIQQYYQLRSCRAVAELYGCSLETIRRILKAEGIALTGWKQEPKKPKRTRTVLTEETKQRIAEAYLRLGTYKKVAAEIGCSLPSVNKTIRELGLGVGTGGNQTQRKVTDDEILEDIALGLTRQEIADKRGVHVDNLARRMKKLGVHARHAEPKEKEKPTEWHYTEGGKRFVDSHQGGRFEFVAYLNGRYKIRCKECGAVLERAKSTILKKNVRCENCYETEQLNAALLTLVQRVATAYCSVRPPKGKAHRNIRNRCRHYGVTYEPGITLGRVYARDGGVCQICGKLTDWNDNTWHEHFGPLYPTIDHINALANGGAHTWNNVQLAHAICNSYKRDLPTEEIKLT